MKKIFLFFLLLACSSYILSSNPLRLGIITDTHFMSPQLMDKGSATQNYINSSGREIIASPDILDYVVNEYLQSDIDALLICGDLVRDGEKQSHFDFKARMKPLIDKGIKVFVIPGNHDVNIDNTTGYLLDTTKPTNSTSPEDFEEIYGDCGYQNVTIRHGSSLSYMAEIDETTLLLAIDASVYDSRHKRTITYGKVDSELRDWIELCLQTAQKLHQGKRVVAMMHWGVAEHLPMQATFFKDYLVDEYQDIASLLADNGVELIFTGHFHSNDITAYQSEKGNTIYDIETGTLASYPFSYRFVELRDQEATITTRNISALPNHPNLAKENIEVLKKLVSQRAQSMLKEKASFLDPQEIEELTAVAAELFIIHLKGDEVVPDSLKERISSIFKKREFPVDESLNNLNLDFPPLDNNITIPLKK